MKDIVIIGTGKAAFLHYYSYKKMKNIGNIYFVDIDGKIKNKNIDNGQKVYTKIADVIEKNKLNAEDLIVDICTPRSVFLDVIAECKILNINKIIVEKPFIVDEKYFEDNKELDIAMVRNYSYSEIVNTVKKIINDNKLKIRMVYTNFSKNRMEQSFNGRGMYKSVTRNIEHDIPHQIYMTQYILGDNGQERKLLLKEEKAMVKENKRLPRHGYSKTISMAGDVCIIYESDFSTNTKIRELIVTCNDDIAIKGEFLFYDEDLNKLENGSVQVLKNGKLVKNIEISFDDNMYECLNDMYNYFNTDGKSKKYHKSIIDFSKEIKLYLNDND